MLMCHHLLVILNEANVLRLPSRKSLRLDRGAYQQALGRLMNSLREYPEPK
jgi:hypothetical protein